jgi:hypothetical protein
MSLSSELEKLQLLLDRVSYIDEQYKKTKKEDSFNIFDILSKKFDEVNLHSRFIYELLNPAGSHNCDTTFLKLFLTLLNIDDFNFVKVKVRREYRKIDLLISNDRQAIVIENKLWAADQPGQLQRYHELLQNEGYQDIRIFYLSIYGKEPEDHSTGALKERADWDTLFAAISYKEDIEHWLECCIKEAYAKPVLRETLVQYRALIWEISGKTMHKEEMDEIVELLAQGENMIKAKKVAENWDHARWFTEWYFWTELERVIAEDYTIKDIQKFSGPKLDSVIHHRRNQNPWYGLMFQVGNYLDAEACVFIERGVDNVYYGLTMVTGGTKQQSGDIRFQPLAEKIAVFSEWFQETHWIGGNFCKPEINFSKFSEPATLKLLNDDYRANYINQLWQQIKSFIGQVKTVIEE